MNRYQVLLQFPFLNPQDVADIVWAAERVKPVSGLQLDGVDERDINCLANTLNNYRLHTAYRIANEKHLVNGKLITFAVPRLSVSLTYEGVIAGVQLDCPCQRQCKESQWQAYGRLYGYPETAVRGFVEKSRAEEEEVLPLVFTDDELRFFLIVRPFRLSASHWREEALVVREWICSFKKAAPNSLYLHHATITNNTNHLNIRPTSAVTSWAFFYTNPNFPTSLFIPKSIQGSEPI